MIYRAVHRIKCWGKHQIALVFFPNVRKKREILTILIRKNTMDIETTTPQREQGPPIFSKREEDNASNSDRWHLLGTRVPKAEIVYFCQMIIVYTIIITSVINLSLQNGSSELWIALLSSNIGYVLPNPKLKKR